MNTYKMKLEDSVDSMIFDLLEVPIVDKDVEGAVDNTTVDGNVFTDYLWLKKNYVQKWSIMCDDEYSQLRGFYTRQFDNASVPTYKLYTGQNLSEDFIASGKYIMVNNTTDYNAPINSFQLLGDAEQTTYSGKNLLNINATPTLTNTTVSVSGQTITVTTNNSSNVGMAQLPFTYEANRPVTVSFDAKMIQNDTGGGLISQVCLRTPNSSDTMGNVRISDTVGQTNHYRATVTPDNNTRWLWLYTKATAVSGVVKVEYSNIQIEYSSDETAYEPYVGGTASPNPDYPQEVNTVTGEQTVKIEGKNLFDVGDSFDSWFACDTNGTRILSGDITTKITGSISNNKITINTYDSSGGYWWMGKLVTLPKNETLTAMTADGTHMRLNVVGFDSLGVNTIGTVLLDWRPTSTTAQQFNTGGYKFYAVTIYPSVASGNNSGVVDKLQLELGSQASDYEAYQGQTLPVNLGKNLCNEVIMAGGGSILLFTFDKYIVQAGTYTLSTVLNADVVNNTVSLVLDGSSAGNIGTVYGTAGTTITCTFTLTDTQIASIRQATTAQIRIYKSGAGFTVPTWAQLELGSQATSYAPYFTPIELAGVGEIQSDGLPEYRDSIYKTDGKWYVEKEVWKVVLDGSEAWTRSTYGNYSAYYNTTYRDMGNKPKLCDYYTYRNAVWNTITTAPILCENSNPDAPLLIFSGFTDITSVADWRTWLSGHPTTVYSALATPTTTEITNQALIDQLNAIENAYLYTGINNISNSSVNLAGDIDLGYTLIYEKENIIIPQTSVRLTLTDGGVINVCGCRQNVQLGMRETIQ